MLGSCVEYFSNLPLDIVHARCTNEAAHFFYISSFLGLCWRGVVLFVAISYSLTNSAPSNNCVEAAEAVSAQRIHYLPANVEQRLRASNQTSRLLNLVYTKIQNLGTEKKLLKTAWLVKCVYAPFCACARVPSVKNLKKGKCRWRARFRLEHGFIRKKEIRRTQEEAPKSYAKKIKAKEIAHKHIFEIAQVRANTSSSYAVFTSLLKTRFRRCTLATLKCLFTVFVRCPVCSHLAGRSFTVCLFFNCCIARTELSHNATFNTDTARVLTDSARSRSIGWHPRMPSSVRSTFSI